MRDQETEKRNIQNTKPLMVLGKGKSRKEEQTNAPEQWLGGGQGMKKKKAKTQASLNEPEE